MTKGERLKAIEALSGRAVKLIDSFQARALSNVWWAFASMREAPSPVLLESLMQQSIATTDDFAPQTIANTLWSMARLRIPPNPELLLALSTRAIFIAHEFQPQVLPVFVWVCSRSCVRAMRVPVFQSEAHGSGGGTQQRSFSMPLRTCS